MAFKLEYFHSCVASIDKILQYIGQYILQNMYFHLDVR